MILSLATMAHHMILPRRGGGSPRSYICWYRSSHRLRCDRLGIGRQLSAAALPTMSHSMLFLQML